MAEQAKPWTHYRARLARLSHDPTGNADEIATVRRLMGRAHLRHRAEQLAHDATAAHLTAKERDELAALIRDGGEKR